MRTLRFSPVSALCSIAFLWLPASAQVPQFITSKGLYSVLLGDTSLAVVDR